MDLRVIFSIKSKRLTFYSLLFVFIVVALVPYKILQSNKILIPMVGISLLGLAGLFVFGHEAGNAQSWFKIGASSLQPSEFVKLCVIIYLSAVYAKKQTYINEFNKGVVPPLAYLVLVLLFVAIQPDIGTAAIILIIASTIIFSSGMSYRNIFKVRWNRFSFSHSLYSNKANKLFSDVRMGRISSISGSFC